MINDLPSAIAHIDADHFFVNCELARRPDLRGKPVMVLGKLGSCILAKSPEAKAMGIKTAMPLWDAKKLCPNGIYLHGEFRYYTQISRQFMSLLREWSPEVQVHSIDEAYINMKGLDEMYHLTYGQIADRIRQQASDKLGITVSVGVSLNKVLSKMACETVKPNGSIVIPANQIKHFLSDIPVADIPGVGRRRQEKLADYRVKTSLDLANCRPERVKNWFGSSGLLLWRELNGQISFPLDTSYNPPKSITRTSSFDRPTPNISKVHGLAVYHLERAMEALYRHQLLTGELTLYLRNKEFKRYGLEHRFHDPTNDFYQFTAAIQKLVTRIPRNQIWRSAGVFFHRLVPNNGRQLSLFDDPTHLDNIEKLNEAKLALNQRFGRTMVRSGTTLFINNKCKPKGARMGLPLI